MGNTFTHTRDENRALITAKPKNEKNSRYNKKIKSLEKIGMTRCGFCSVYGFHNPNPCICQTVAFSYIYGFGTIPMC